MSLVPTVFGFEAGYLLGLGHAFIGFGVATIGLALN
jgi:hypothetical protein